MNVLKHLILLLTLSSLLIFCTNPPKQEKAPEIEVKDKVLMAIFSHPDDESTVAPILARYAKEGVKVYIVIATDGRLGVNDFSGLEAGDGLVAIRKEEMKCSADILGAELIHLDYHDQFKAAEGYDGHMPQAKGLIKEIHQLITDIKPDVLITWGPDGGTNHMDHRLVEATVTGIFVSQKWEKPQALYYYGTPASQLDTEEAKILRGVRDDYLTTQISFTDEDYDLAIESMLCHKSQFNPEGLRERMMARKKENIIYLRQFVGPQKTSNSLFY